MKPFRQYIWKNAGFTKLRDIRRYIEHYEPRFEPTVVPMASLVEEDESLVGGGQLTVTSSNGSSDGTAVHAASNSNGFLAVPSSNGGVGKSVTSASGVPPVIALTDTRSNALAPAARYHSIEDYHNLYKSGELTPTAVARAVLPLIRRDVAQPTAHAMAWFEINAEAILAAAEASTKRYAEGRPLGVLDGVPTAIKDEYDLDGYQTTHGSKNDYWGAAHADENESYTSWCVRKVEETGALILGKLSMHEFGLDTSGNNPIFGTPRNPYNARYYPGGSSSGTAYAVATGLVPFALGADGGGSIRIPASFCGVLGIKPTHGRLSFRPNQNHSSTCAVNGPIAADMASLATALEIMAEPHHNSPFPPLPPLLTPTPSHAAAGSVPLGVPRDWFERADPTVKALCRSLLQRLVSERNYHLVDVTIPFLVEGQIAHAMVVLNDAATLLPVDPKQTDPAFRTEYTAPNRILLALGRTTPATDYLLAQKLRALLMSHLAWLWKTHPGMVLVTPTTSCAGWRMAKPEVELRHGVSDGDTTLKTMEFVWMANFCGLPAVSVPAGFVLPEGAAGAGHEAVATPEHWDDDGAVPVGLMGMGEWTTEESLMRFARDAEVLGAEKRRRPPNWVDVVALARQEMLREKTRESEEVHEKAH